MRTACNPNIISVQPRRVIPHTSGEARCLNFRKITMADMPRIWEILRHEEGRTTDFSFGGIAMWVDYFNYEFAIVDDTLFIKGVLEDDRTTPAFSLPVGKLSLAESIALLRDYCAECEIPLEFSAVPEYAVSSLRQLGAREVYELADWGDYLYEAEKLTSLSGKKMAKKRNHVNRFHALYDGRWSYEAMTADNSADALKFMDVYDLEGDDNQQAADERILSRRILGEFSALTPYMTGGILRVDGKVAAYAVGDVKGDTLYVHIEKATRAIEGSYEVIAQLYASMMCEANPEVRYINREDDGGDPGLRKAKQSYHPLEVLRKFNVLF